MRLWIVIPGVLVLLSAESAIARPKVEPGTPAIVQSLLQCRAIADSAQRLACYDRATSGVAQAIDKKDIVMIDKERATAAKRSLFGFSVPDFAGMFGGGDVKEITSSVAGVGQNADGGWTIRLEDGSVWTQTDDKPMAIEPRRGDKVVVKRGALGSYFVQIGRQPGFKAKRTG